MQPDICIDKWTKLVIFQSHSIIAKSHRLNIVKNITRALTPLTRTGECICTDCNSLLRHIIVGKSHRTHMYNTYDDIYAVIRRIGPIRPNHVSAGPHQRYCIIKIELMRPGSSFFQASGAVHPNNRTSRQTVDL